MSKLKVFEFFLPDFSRKPLRFFQIVLLGCIGFSMVFNMFFQEPAFAQKVIGDGLLITPPEVKLGGRVRSGLVTFKNMAPDRTSYRVSVVGPLDSDEGTDASKWIRFSPRRVTLDPGEIQKVRVLARMPSDAEKGKYIARLLIQAIPPKPKPKKKDEKPPENVSVEIVIVYGMTVPIRINNQ